MPAWNTSRIKRERTIKLQHLLVVLGLLVATILLLGGSGSALALDTAGAASAVWRSESKVDVLLGVETDDERGDVDDLLADATVPLR